MMARVKIELTANDLKKDAIHYMETAEYELERGFITDALIHRGAAGECVTQLLYRLGANVYVMMGQAYLDAVCDFDRRVEEVFQRIDAAMDRLKELEGK